MTDVAQIGPGQPCSHCGGEYGFHKGGCRNRRVDRRTGLPADIAIHELRGELGRVLNAIRRHRDQRGDDRCWLDDRELYAVLPEGYTPPTEDSAVELERCQQYIRCRHDPATTYVSPQRRIEELERLVISQAERIAAQSELLARQALRGLPANQ